MVRALRFLIAAAIVGVCAVVAAVLLWADRGVGIGDRIISFVAEAGRAFERTMEINVIDRDDIPGRTDQIGHAVLWAVGTVIVGAVRLTRRSLPWVTTELALASIVFEVAQPLVSPSRSFQETDVVANLIGVGIGALILGVGMAGLWLVRIGEEWR